MVTYIAKNYKSILNVHKFIDNWFWTKYGINTYNGCQFGCIYCDSRSEKYYLPRDFHNTIMIKENVKDMLDKRLTRARKLLPDVVGMSGANDPYQPAEIKYKNTRQCLEVIEKHNYPVHICTKSTLVSRDLDLLEQIGTSTWCTVSITITTPKSRMARFLETRVPVPQKRFDVIKKIKTDTKHIQAGVLLIPVVPYLCDSDEDLEIMVKQTKEAGADYILFGGGMTMRDLQAQWYLKHLKERYPELIPHYEDLYRFHYNQDSYEGTYEPKKTYARMVDKKLAELCEKYKLRYRIKRFIPHDYRKENYAIAEKLFSIAYDNRIADKNWKNMYWTAHNIQNLRESIVSVAIRNELQTIRNVNGKIELLIKKALYIL
jgi:DNA repair photolyase